MGCSVVRLGTGVKISSDGSPNQCSWRIRQMFLNILECEQSGQNEIVVRLGRSYTWIAVLRHALGDHGACRFLSGGLSGKRTFWVSIIRGFICPNTEQFHLLRRHVLVSQVSGRVETSFCWSAYMEYFVVVQRFSFSLFIFQVGEQKARERENQLREETQRFYNDVCEQVSKVCSDH